LNSIIEEELFEELEKLIGQNGFSNRSEFIRDLIRKQLTRKQCARSGKVIGTISVLCDLNFPGIENKLTGVLDHAPVKILGATRFAVEPHHSTTMISAEGIGMEIRELVNAIRQLKGVSQAEFVITAPAPGMVDKTPQR